MRFGYWLQEWHHGYKWPKWVSFRGWLDSALEIVWALRAHPNGVRPWGRPRGYTVGSPRRSWKMLLRRGMSGPPCLVCCICYLAQDNWQKMDGLMGSQSLVTHIESDLYKFNLFATDLPHDNFTLAKKSTQRNVENDQKKCLINAICSWWVKSYITLSSALQSGLFNTHHHTRQQLNQYLIKGVFIPVIFINSAENQVYILNIFNLQRLWSADSWGHMFCALVSTSLLVTAQ